MKIKVVVPVTSRQYEEPTLQECRRFASPGTGVRCESIPYGAASIESFYDEALCAPGVIKACERAEEEGFDGVFVTCMGDPGVAAAREKVSIPVVGPARVSMLFAADLAYRFSIVSTVRSFQVPARELAAGVGLEGRLASVRSVDIPVLELEQSGGLGEALLRESLQAIEQDGAHAVILGCTGMMGVAGELAAGLRERGYRVPVIYPVAVAVRYLETLVTLGLTQSKATYPVPPEKERNIWERL